MKVFRQSWLTETIVGLTDTLVTDYDLFEFLDHLADRCQELLEAEQATVVLFDGKELKTLASSTERAHTLELVEAQNDDGPFLECIIRGGCIDASLVDDETLAKWPNFLEIAVAAGYQRVLILPMRLRERALGAMAVWREQSEVISNADRELAQALTDVATIATALRSSIAIEQAKGILTEHYGISLDEAFSMLRTRARNDNRRLGELAREIAEQRVPASEEVKRYTDSRHVYKPWSIN